MQVRDAEVLFAPDSSQLRFLPEGPIACGVEMFSWVAIQHAQDIECGSLNVFDLQATHTIDQNSNIPRGLHKALAHYRKERIVQPKPSDWCN